MELSDDEKLVLEAVRDIQYIKIENRQQPDYAMQNEVYNYLIYEVPKQRVLQALRLLYRKGLIEFHKNVNGLPMFGIINKNQK